MRELWTRVVQTSGARIYGLLLSVLTLSASARVLGPEGRGTVAVITTWATMFCTFGHLSLGQVALHRLALERERYGSVLGSLVVVALGVSAVGWLAAVVLLVSPGSSLSQLPAEAVVVGFLALPFLVWEQYGSSLLMGLEKLTVFNKFQIIGRTTTVVLMLLAYVTSRLNVTAALLSTLVGQILVAVGGFDELLKETAARAQRVAATRDELRALLVGGVRLHVNAIGTFLLSSSNVLILDAQLGVERTGQFQLAVQLMTVMMVLPQAAGMVVYGKVANMGPANAWPVNRRLLKQVMAFMIVAGLVIGLLASWWLPLLAGPSFAPSVTIFRWLLLTLPGTTMSMMMAPQWIGRGFFVSASLVTIGLGLISLLANYVLIARYGVDGACAASILTYACTFLTNAWMYMFCERRAATAEKA